MPTLICELDKRLKNSLQETEDRWRLFRGDNGFLYVEHTWSHTKLKNLVSDEGEEKVDVHAFLEGTHPWASGARNALRAHLREHGGDFPETVIALGRDDH